MSPTSASPAERARLAAARRAGLDDMAPLDLLPAAGAPPVPARTPKSTVRPYVVHTTLQTAHGTLLDRITQTLRQKQGRKIRANDVLERAIEALGRELGLPLNS